MNDNYLTVKEFAEAVGISRQAVYRQLDNKLQEFTVKVDNRVMVDKVAITKVYHKLITDKVESVDSLDKVDSQPSKPGEDVYRDAYIRLLERQLEQAEERARKLEEERDTQIERLSTVIDSIAAMNQRLQIENNQYKALIESPVEAANDSQDLSTVEEAPGEAAPGVEENHADPQRNKRGIFGFLRRK